MIIKLIRKIIKFFEPDPWMPICKGGINKTYKDNVRPPPPKGIKLNTKGIK